MYSAFSLRSPCAAASATSATIFGSQRRVQLGQLGLETLGSFARDVERVAHEEATQTTMLGACASVADGRLPCAPRKQLHRRASCNRTLLVCANLIAGFVRVPPNTRKGATAVGATASAMGFCQSLKSHLIASLALVRAPVKGSAATLLGANLDHVPPAFRAFDAGAEWDAGFCNRGSRYMSKKSPKRPLRTAIGFPHLSPR